MVAVKEADVVEAQAKQREASKNATFELLRKKKLAEKTFTVHVNGEAYVMKYRAIGHQQYDDLVGKYPPTPDERAEGALYSTKGFAPALISAVSVEPKLSLDEAKELWGSSDWSRGDLMVLFSHAVDVCNTGFDVNFTASA